MNNAHAALTLRAAHVAASALSTIALLRPVLGPPKDEVRRFEEVIEELRALYLPPPPASRRRPVQRLEDLPDVELESSDWDPEPVYEASRCKAFLMEIIRRAASDWVQYRQARRMDLKMLADQAYTWLFEEEPGHPAWKDRERALFKIEDEETGRPTIEVGTRRITSFLAICEACELDPEVVRARAREMTIEQVTRTGRRIERRGGRSSESMSIESHSVVVDVDLDALDAEGVGDGHDMYDQRLSFSDRAFF